MTELESTVTENMMHEEQQYLNMIRDVIATGDWVEGRNGRVCSLFGKTMRFSLRNNTIPFLTTKQLAWKTCLKELLWFISGNTSNSTLNDMGVKIWNQNASREFLDSRGLDYPEGDLGPIYGFQWRHFDANYVSCDTNYQGQGVDQLQNIIDALKDPSERFSRRLVMTAWNPKQIDRMALPPCHILCQFKVNSQNELSCMLYQRSGDIGLGVPFNIASYSFLTHLLAHHCGLKCGDFVHVIGDAHIYEDHIEPLRDTQLKRTPYEFPKLNIKANHESIDEYTFDDFEILNYNYHPKIQMNMSA